MASNINEVPIPSSNSGSTDKINPTVHVEREHIVFPAHPSHRHRINLSAFDLRLLLVDYDQTGLLYDMPAHGFSSAVTRLEQSLSNVLTSFYQLAGRLATSPSDGAIYTDCNDAGAAFIEASAENVTTADVMAADVSVVVNLFFPLNGVLNIEGHRVPLLAVQVTKLHDGIFVTFSLNHAVADGAALWHFFNSWAEICSGRAQNFSINPVYDRCGIPSRSLVLLNLDPDAEIRRFCPPPLRVKIFHFVKGVLNGLKDRANSGRESLPPISSLQALCAHVWQAITRARGLGREELTTFQLVVDCRSRLVPPLPSSYFGNAIDDVNVTSTAGEVASNEVSFPAQLLQGIVQRHDDMAIKERNDEWEKNPTLVTRENMMKSTKNYVHLGSSPRFKMYETDFGWGKPLAARAGCANRMDGKVTIFPGREQDGSVDLDICLVSETMNALENDQHFLNPILPGSFDSFR